MEKILEEMIEMQRAKLLAHAERYIPNITSEDILQPNDFPVLENSPHFRYQEGVLEGLLAARAALRVKTMNDEY
jgi:hypothetical protein